MEKIIKRNYGIDALRLISMFMVVVLHVLGQGGVLKAAKNGQYIISWLLEIIAYCAVNCYAIISGYVGYSDVEKPYRYSKYLTMWVQVACYSFGITAVAFILKPESIGLVEMIKSALPVATNQYWYFSAYTGLFFVIPFLNCFMRMINEKQAKNMVITILVLFVCYATVGSYFSDSFKLEGGYSFIWLVLLYLLGAWMKKYSIPDKMKARNCVVTICACVFLTWVCKIFVPAKLGGTILVSYISPTMVGMAISYVILFSKWHPKNRGIKVVKCFAPAAFGVYLIHTQWVVWGHFMRDAFIWIADSAVWLIPVQVFGCATGIFVVCLLIEKMRLLIFKALHINEVLENFCEKIQKRLLRIL